jgi:hypothetical protein
VEGRHPGTFPPSQYEYSLEGNELRKIEAVVDYRLADWGKTHLKARVNHSLGLAVAGKHEWSERLQCAWGVQWSRSWRPEGVSLGLSFGKE